MTSPGSTELSVRSEPIQTLYGYYLTDRFQVNRRYQRKLVWSVEEKQRLIDSILKGMPIPLFLVAEIGLPPEAPYELIDGMQRLNAIFSFIENEFAVGGNFFDLDSLADTKQLKDQGLLEQRTPIMERSDSVKIANYAVALSVFRSLDSASVDDVFRRINSGGRRLSRQELRQAGTVSSLADLVRVLSSRIRTDTSPGDVVPLKMMPHLSITNRDLPYGVPADDIFWVKEGILRREDVRESADEQAVLDLLIDCLVDPTVNSGTRIRDAYYDFSDELEGNSPSRESVNMANLISVYGAAKLETDFMRVYDEIRAVLATQDSRFSLLIGTSGGRSPRYFHVVFMTFYELMVREHMRLHDRGKAAEKLRGTGKDSFTIPPGGGDWNKDSKRKSIDAVKGVVLSCFEKTSGPEDYSQFGWSSELEVILGNAVVEQQMFDCKQGFLSLGQNRSFDEISFSKICRTLTAMANRGPGAVGHVAIGIADNTADADRVKQLDGVTSVKFKTFNVVGLEREAIIQNKSLNDYVAWLIQRLRAASKFDPRLSGQVASNARVMSYHGRVVLLLKVVGQDQPFFYSDELVDRSGSDTKGLTQSDYFAIFRRFGTSG